MSGFGSYTYIQRHLAGSKSFFKIAKEATNVNSDI